MSDFADALKTGRAPTVTGHSALAAQTLIDAIPDAARTGQLTEVTRA